MKKEIKREFTNALLIDQNIEDTRQNQYYEFSDEEREIFKHKIERTRYITAMHDPKAIEERADIMLEDGVINEAKYNTIVENAYKNSTPKVISLTIFRETGILAYQVDADKSVPELNRIHNINKVA